MWTFELTVLNITTVIKAKSVESWPWGLRVF